MAEERDLQVSAAYRDLGAEEPPRALDEAILAAARRQARPWTQRFAAPLGLAAVLVLSVTVTLRMQHERPGIESPTASPNEPAAAAPVQEEPLKLKPEVQIKSAAEPARQRQAPRKEQAEPKPFAEQAPAAAAAPAPANADMFASRSDSGRGAESNIAGALSRQTEERTSRDAEAAARAHQAGALLAKRPLDQQPSPAAAAPAPQQPAKAAEQAARVSAETPEREFERIAQLRAEGRHDEADKAFLEFRRRYPGFRITEEMLRRVERR